MSRNRPWMMIAATLLLVWAAHATVLAQIPLGITSARGLTATPVYEGWYENSDGTFTLSFGYFNRNREEVLEIPIGQDNFIEPAEFDGVQPTQLNPRRHWGVFGVKVPADFRGTVVWTINIRGETNSIPGALKTDWKIDAPMSSPRLSYSRHLSLVTQEARMMPRFFWYSLVPTNVFRAPKRALRSIASSVVGTISVLSTITP